MQYISRLGEVYEKQQNNASMELAIEDAQNVMINSDNEENSDLD